MNVESFKGYVGYKRDMVAERDVVNSVLTGVCSSIILAKGLRHGCEDVFRYRACALAGWPFCWGDAQLTNGANSFIGGSSWDVERDCGDGTTCVEGVLFGWEP
eukprot:289932-Pelagomonas_calceolata.AAC.1